MTKFSEKLHAKIKKANEDKPIPSQMIQAFDALIKMALMGQVGQMEIAAGISETENRKVRIIVIPDRFGEVIENADGKKMRMVMVPHELGEIKEIV